MKRMLVIGMVLLLSISMLAGCGGGGDNGDSAGSDKKDSSKTAETSKGETYSAENISATVPDGWKAFPFYSGGEESPNTFSVQKGALTALDIWSTPGIQISLFPDGSGFGSNTQKDMYEDVMDLAPLTVGDYTWSGFSGLSKNSAGEYVLPFAILWTDAGNDKIQATVWLEMEGNTITLLDWDVQAILGSVKPK